MIDISQELFTCAVYPGDTSPSRRRVQSIGKGDACNLTDLTLCAHNGTHLDAPLHFIEGGKGVDEGRKSVAFNLVLRADDRSLTGDEADADVKKVLEALASQLGAVLR